MHPIIVKAPAKINLSLRIVGKRNDGYHLLESLVVFTEYGDEIQVINYDNLSLEIIGEFSPALTSEGIEQNLVWKAANALKKYAPANCGAKIILIKNLPIASGIGGGSADAAATLKALRELWKLDISDHKLAEIGLSLGSDVPVCLYGMPSIMKGTGEEITPFRLPEKAYIVLINPNIPLATADVFRSFSGNFSKPMSEQDVIEYTNDLEDAATEKLPEIGEILVSLSYTKGCYLVNMSGSGATCFGLYHDKISADNAKKELQNTYPEAWCVSSVIK